MHCFPTCCHLILFDVPYKLHVPATPSSTMTDRKPAFLYSYLPRPSLFNQSTLISSNSSADDEREGRLHTFEKHSTRAASFSLASNSTEIKRLSLQIKDLE